MPATAFCPSIPELGALMQQELLPSDLDRLFSRAGAERKRRIEKYRHSRKEERANYRARLEAEERADRVERALASFWGVADRLKAEAPEIAEACRERQMREHHCVIQAAYARQQGRPALGLLRPLYKPLPEVQRIALQRLYADCWKAASAAVSEGGFRGWLAGLEPAAPHIQLAKKLVLAEPQEIELWVAHAMSEPGTDELHHRAVAEGSLWLSRALDAHLHGRALPPEDVWTSPTSSPANPQQPPGDLDKIPDEPPADADSCGTTERDVSQHRKRERISRGEAEKRVSAFLEKHRRALRVDPWLFSIEKMSQETGVPEPSIHRTDAYQAFNRKRIKRKKRTIAVLDRVTERPLTKRLLGGRPDPSAQDPANAAAGRLGEADSDTWKYIKETCRSQAERDRLDAMTPAEQKELIARVSAHQADDA